MNAPSPSPILPRQVPALALTLILNRRPLPPPLPLLLSLLLPRRLPLLLLPRPLSQKHLPIPPLPRLPAAAARAEGKREGTRKAGVD